MQKIAAMSTADRDAFIKKMVRIMRKEQGLKDDDNNSGTQMIAFGNNKNAPVDLFPTANTNGVFISIMLLRKEKVLQISEANGAIEIT